MVLVTLIIEKKKLKIYLVTQFILKSILKNILKLILSILYIKKTTSFGTFGLDFSF